MLGTKGKCLHKTLENTIYLLLPKREYTVYKLLCINIILI